MIKRLLLHIPLLLIILFTITGCNAAPGEISSISAIYGIITVISLLLVAGYCILLKKRETWLLFLYIAVLVVNCGYLALSVSGTLEEALLANRVSYLGSVFLPVSMLLTIMDVCRIKYRKKVPVILICIGIAVFLIAASPGYSDLYYSSVSLGKENGVTILIKEYGPFHPLYLVYLLGYFTSMICVIVYSILKKHITSGSHATILAVAVLGNIAVWGIEQIIDLPFEFLSVSYIITELFLLMLFLMLQEYEPILSPMPADVIRSHPEGENIPESEDEGYRHFLENIPFLTPSEKNIYEMYVSGKSTKEITEALSISENTIKTHNKNIYKKLGVTSRKQMIEYAGRNI